MTIALRCVGVVLVLLSGQVSAGCGSDRWTVNVDQSAGTVRPGTLEACRGDEVTWTSAGAAGFDLQFSGGRSPGNPQRRGAWFVVAIDAPPGKYPYSVVFAGKRLESAIIVK